MGLLADLLDVREAFDTRLHPHVKHGSRGGQFEKKLGLPSVTTKPLSSRPTRVPEGSGPARKQVGVPRPPGQATRTDIYGKPRAPGAGSERAPAPGNVRKLKTHELPGAIGRGTWTPSAKRAAEDLKAGRVVDTEHAHRAKSADGSLGHYSPERIALHAQIAKALLQGADHHPGSARAVFLAGGPASGKSTLLKQGHVHVPADAVDVNPDIVRSMLPEYKALVAAGDKSASAKTHEEASHISKLVANLALSRQHHVVFDTVGNSGPGAFRKKIEAAKEHGHAVSVHYATVSTQEALRRSAARAADPKSESFGRHVPEGFLRSAHQAVSERYANDISKIDGVHLQVFDTTSKRVKRVAEKFPSQAKLKVHHAKLHDAFVAKAMERVNSGA